YQNGDVKKLEQLLSGITALNPQLFHIDNANPIMINAERTRLFIRYLTPGSTAAIGVESFDDKVIKANNLNSNFEQVFTAIETLNKFGSDKGKNGCYKLLPGINILLGLKGETKKTLEINFERLNQIMEAGLLFRRINIRKVVPFPGTELARTTGNSVLQKNKNLYKSWISKVRHKIDLVMLKKLYPAGSVLKNLYSEIHDGNTTFLRQLGSYPIVLGVKRRLPLNRKYDVKVIGHNPRSLVGEVVEPGN
ncbi:MAG: radical SAM protein, partial [Candidatus Cloacimonetes bacterium]|nr:radical SAM protein [Candidatus Cloacimonadota bacterium]